MVERPSIFTDQQIAKFVEHITDPEERAKQEAWFREFGRTGARMNKAFRTVIPSIDNGQAEGESKENG